MKHHHSTIQSPRYDETILQEWQAARPRTSPPFASGSEPCTASPTAFLGLLTALVLACVSLTNSAQAAPKQRVPIGFQFEADFEFGPSGGTGYAQVTVDRTSIRMQVTGNPQQYFPLQESDSKVVTLEVDKAYDFISEGKWDYQGGLIRFGIPKCFTLTIYDHDTPLVTLDYYNNVYPRCQHFNYTIKAQTTPVSFSSSCTCGTETTDPSLIADGTSEAGAWVNGISTAMAWGFDGPDLGCKIRPIDNGSRAIVTAGEKTGDVVVVGTMTTSPYCVYKGVLSLVRCDSGCSSADCDTTFASVRIDNESGVDFLAGIGKNLSNQTAGSICLRAATPGSDLASPVALQLLYPGVDTEAIWSSDSSLRQVKVTSGLVDLVVIDAFQYELRFYRASAVSAVVDGLYTLQGGANPVATVTVRNPNSGGNYNELWIIESHGGPAKTYKYTYDHASLKWTLEDDQSLRKLLAWKEIVGSTRYEHREIRKDTTLLSKVRRKYEPVDNRHVLKELLEGDGSTTRTTTYTFYTSSGNGDNDNQLRQIDYPDGRWEIFEYDSNKRVIKTYSAWLDQAPTTTASLCRVTEYAYTLTEAGDNGTYAPHLPRRTIVKVLGQEVARTYHKRLEGEQVHKTCPQPGAAWGDGANLVTTTTYYSTGDNKGRVKDVTNPDGTMAFYTYTTTTDTFTTTVSQGEPNLGATAIKNGTQTVTEIGQYGELKSRVVKNIVNEATPSTTLSSETYTYLDDLKQSYQVTYLGGLTRQVQYACCGIESETDQDGLTTTFDYDYWKREVASRQVQFNLKQTNILDAAGRTLERRRIGSDGSTIMLEQTLYDVLGRVTVQTNALGAITSYSETLVNNKLRRIIAYYPDTGQRIEDYYRDGRLEKVTGSAVAPVRHDYGVEYETDAYREFSKETKLYANGNPTLEWTKTYTDGARRGYRTAYAAASTPYPYRRTTYNTKGQPIKERDPDGVSLLSQFNAKGELEFSAVDLNQDGLIDFSGSDRVTRITRDVTTYAGSDVQRTQTSVYTTDNQPATALVSTVQTSTDGLKSWQTAYRDPATPVTTASVTTYGGGGSRTVTATYPDNSSQVSIYSYGRLTTVTRRDAGSGQVTQTSYAYDTHGRVRTMTDARNGTTTNSYNNADLVTTVMTPPPGSGEPGQVTTTFYDPQGRVTGYEYADGSTSTNLFYLTRLLRKTSGSRTYPVEYTYDDQGRMRTMKTWQDFGGNSGTATTTWNYDSYRGWLTSKDYPNAGDGTAGTLGPDYSYTAGGRLKTRTWARPQAGPRIVTTYYYGFDDDGLPGGSNVDQHGDLSRVIYSNDPASTPESRYAYDRRGRQRQTIRNGITTDWTYNDANQPLTETHSGGTLSGLSMNWTYDTALRRYTVTASKDGTPQQAATYGYDSAGRLLSVSDASYSATYGYDANSFLINTLTLAKTSGGSLVTTRAYDKLNRLQSISSAPSAASAVSFAYQYNQANQRTRATLENGSYWVYQYDGLGQVISGCRFGQDGTPVAGHQFEYRFDDIGNRDTTGGRASSVSDYTANRLNQYTTRTVPAYVDVTGIANPTAGVTVNGNTANRKGEYFHWPLNVPNSSAQYPTVTVTSQYGAGESDSGKVYVPAASEAFSHDDDGNLTADGRWTYTWDGDNRLIEMRRDSDSPAGARQRLLFEYDHQGRRIRKQFYAYSGGWQLQMDTICLYDGWNVVCELSGSKTPLRTYVWGTDLSGSLTGAGGVGGLLWVNNEQTTYGGKTVPTGVHFVAYDGNGNVAALVSAADGTTQARYEYGPFAEPIRTTGDLADANPFRFSTKWTDNESGLLYYGYRYYNPATGRWPSRDPLEELGFRRTFLRKRLKAGHHTYAFVGNNPVNRHDVDGLGIACAVKWASQVELGHAGPMNCAGSAIADAFLLLKSSYPNYDPKSNGHNALHCLANCLMAKYCQFPGKTDEEIYEHMMDANIDYEFCTMKEELCGKWCGDVDAYKRDYESDIKADIVGIRAGLAGKDCVSACEPETRTPGPKQPDSCDCKVVKECEGKYFDKDGNLKPDTRPF